jgi:phosphopantetheinyl transferase (holo-ACP synthase)
MVGNDVVDLGDRETLEGPTHPRFDARVFRPEERGLLRGSGAPDRTRWMLWAAKEAAYKLARKLEPGTVFSPRRFAVEPTAPGHAEVLHGDRRFVVRIAEAGKALHAVAFEPGSKRRLLWAVEARRGSADPSRAARALAARVLAEEIGVPRSTIHFGRSARIPSAWADGLRSHFDLSFSHHGRFVAFACEAEGVS